MYKYLNLTWYQTLLKACTVDREDQDWKQPASALPLSIQQAGHGCGMCYGCVNLRTGWAKKCRSIIR